MPELPEVETMRRGIACIQGRTIQEVERPRSTLCPIEITPRFADFRRGLVGRRILSVGRIGKRVLLELDTTDRVVFEPRMTGCLMLAAPPTEKHVRLVFRLSGRPTRKLLFWNLRGLGVVRLLSEPEFAARLGPDRLGPDALEVSHSQLRERLGGSRREVKVALLDQRAVAGVGNLYASEILHRAGVHPAKTCDRIRPAEWRRIETSMREVLLEAIEHKGSTLSDGTYRDAENEAGGFQALHRVYQRTDQPCVQCGKGRIVRTVQAQRSTFFCPKCQRPPKT